MAANFATRRRLASEDRLDWLQLIRTEKVGPITFRQLLARFGSAAAALDAAPSLASGRKLKIPSRRTVEDEVARAADFGARPIAACEPDYPEALRATPDAPPIIFVVGHASLFERPAIAIIGARNASLAVKKIAASFAEKLGAAGYVIVSGLARGIDGAAHQASLKSGTIAVVAGGVDVIYPPEHADLTAEIGRQGVVLSERAPGTRPSGRDFPRRNRLISGLARGVVVVEAAARSGTAITARFALDQGREVFAVPGSPLDPRAAGANKLIRDGALLVESADDVIQALARQVRSLREAEQDDFFVPAARSPQLDDKSRARLMSEIQTLLSFTPIHRDEILAAIDAPPGPVIDALIELVLTGVVVEELGGTFALSGA